MKLSPNQRLLLRAVRAHEASLNVGQPLDVDSGFYCSDGNLARTARSLLRRGLLERIDGTMVLRLTDAGRKAT